MISTEELYSLYCGCSYRVSTDSRAISGGEIFFALRGENFDGNAYAPTAISLGARWAVVNDDYEFTESVDSDRLIRVPSPFETLRELAAYHRRQLGIPVVGLTGTNGKTTTKELIAAVLRTRFEVCATEGNLNNDIGVPLSVLKMRPSTQVAVIEMGASHPGDIAALVPVSQPTHGLITNVGKAHLQGFGSFEGVKAAKGELYKWLGSHEGSLLFLNEDDPELKGMARGIACHVFGYGLKYQDVELLPTSASEPFVGLRFPDGEEIRTHLVGAYNASNVLAALAVGEYFGVNRAAALAAVRDYVPSNQRSQMVRTANNTLIVDAYNANPSSMGVALDNLFGMGEGEGAAGGSAAGARVGRKVAAGRRVAKKGGCSKVALLGDMRELGDDSLAEHMAIIRRLSSSGIRYYLVGEEFRKAILAVGLPGVQTTPVPPVPKSLGPQPVPVGTIIPVNSAIPDDSLFRGWFPDSGSLTLELGIHPLRGCIILVKGSRGIRMERVLGAL